MATDYDNYAVIYDCEEYMGGLYHREVSFLLGRTPKVSKDTWDLMNFKLANAVPTYWNRSYFWFRKTWQGYALCNGQPDYGEQ